MKHRILEPIKSGLISGVIFGLLIFFLLPFLKTMMDNVIGHSIDGFFVDSLLLLSGFLYLLCNTRKLVLQTL